MRSEWKIKERGTSEDDLGLWAISYPVYSSIPLTQGTPPPRPSNKVMNRLLPWLCCRHWEGDFQMGKPSRAKCSQPSCSVPKATRQPGWRGVGKGEFTLLRSPQGHSGVLILAGKRWKLRKCPPPDLQLCSWCQHTPIPALESLPPGDWRSEP